MKSSAPCFFPRVTFFFFFEIFIICYSIAPGFFFFFNVFVFWPGGLWDLSSRTSDQTQAPGNENVES